MYTRDLETVWITRSWTLLLVGGQGEEWAWLDIGLSLPFLWSMASPHPLENSLPLRRNIGKACQSRVSLRGNV